MVFNSTISNELPKKHLKKVLYLQPEVKKELEMRSTFKILFYANKGKEKDGIVPIMGRITIIGSQCHRNMQNRLFLFPPWVYSIPTIPSMILPKKSLEGGCKRRKRSEGQDCKCLSIGAPCNLLEHSFQCFIVKDCNKKHRYSFLLHYFR